MSVLPEKTRYFRSSVGGGGAAAPPRTPPPPPPAPTPMPLFDPFKFWTVSVREIFLQCLISSKSLTR